MRRPTRSRMTFRQARQKALEYVQAGIDLSLVQDVLLALSWANATPGFRWTWSRFLDPLRRAMTERS